MIPFEDSREVARNGGIRRARLEIVGRPNRTERESRHDQYGEHSSHEDEHRMDVGC